MIGIQRGKARRSEAGRRVNYIDYIDGGVCFVPRLFLRMMTAGSMSSFPFNVIRHFYC